MRGFLVLVAVAIAATGGPAVARPAKPSEDRRTAPPSPHRETDYDAPTERWREGPVRYLLTKDEDDAYRALASDAERLEFVKRFWARRDPIASTPENEYRALFYRRVAEADRLFTESTKPGWKTDRGKIYVLLGPPDDQEQESRRDDFVPDVIVWTYRSSPAGPGIDSLPVIRFERDPTGEYHMSNRVFLPGLESAAGIAFQVQAMQMKSLPEQTRLLDTIVHTRTAFDAAAFRTHGDFFRAGDGNTFAVLTLGVRIDLLSGTPGEVAPARAGPPRGPSAGEAPGAAAAPATQGSGRFEVLARLSGDAPGLPSYDFAGPSAFRGDGRGAPDASGYLLFQGGLAVRPGAYTAYFGVVDRTTDRLYTYRETIRVPDLASPRFALSGITLASRLERLDRSASSYATPFVLGNLRAVPRPDDVFRNGEEFAFYYQVYGPETDPIDGRPDLDVEYQFFAARDDGAGGLAFVPLGEPIHLARQRSQVQGYSLPLKDWPPAAYRLRVQVTDNLSQRLTTEEISFRVL